MHGMTTVRKRESGMSNVTDRVEKTDAEWRAQLSDLAYKVLRQHGTERAFTHDDFPKQPGMFHCAGCGTALFDQAQKFDSGTGWPSFWAPAEGAQVGTSEDRSWFMRRTEVHCDRCGGHLGHVFPDGPRPTGQRYCINGVALQFKPKD
jgi:peptide-methionine (R)-S-oxide reductase